MGKIALLVSGKDMLYYAHNILQERKYPVDTMEVIRTEDAVSVARRCIAEGASLIIARGLQALLIKQYTDILVVDIGMNPRELDLLIRRAKNIINKERAKIAVIGTENMFPDMDYVESAYNIDLKVYFPKNQDDFYEMAELAVKEDVDMILGGHIAVSVAEKNHIQSLFIPVTEDSLGRALDTAQSLLTMMEAKKEVANIEKMMDYSLHGILHLDKHGCITMLNQTASTWFRKTEDEVQNLHIAKIFKEISEKELESFSLRKDETLFYLSKYQDSLFYITLAKLSGEDGEREYILSCIKRDREIVRTGTESVAAICFNDMAVCSDAMRYFVEEARRYAISEYPLYIQARCGSKVHEIANAIHNESSYQGNPFVSIPASAMNADMYRFFGTDGYFKDMKKGTIHIADIEHLSKESQEIICGIWQKRWLGYAEKELRFIFSSVYTPEELYHKSLLIPEWYYHLYGWCLRLPSLADRKEDMEELMDKRVSYINAKYFRYYHLTKSAKKALASFPWEGETVELYAFLERLLLSSKKRSIDANDVDQLKSILYLTYPKEGDGRKADNSGEKSGSELSIVRAKQIADVLKKNRYHREKTAKELGMSKSTLWRYMKRYGLI